jgi:hypothetical protein
MTMDTTTQKAAELPLFKIKCRFSGVVRFEGRFGSMRLCVEAAVSARANLARADLAGADLTDANLARADLAGADLTDANLARANLAGANLTDANLARANLAGANLTDANLARANLARADLAGANLARADLAGANLARANLAGANLAGAKVRVKNGNETALIGARPLLQMGPLGSRSAMLTIMRTEAGMLAQTGCFGPAPLADFEAAVITTHGETQNGRAYRSAIALARVQMED